MEIQFYYLLLELMYKFSIKIHILVWLYGLDD